LVVVHDIIDHKIFDAWMGTGGITMQRARPVYGPKAVLYCPRFSLYEKKSFG
jgi:hypothetical protein